MKLRTKVYLPQLFPTRFERFQVRLLPQSHEENALKALVHSGHFLPAKIGIIEKQNCHNISTKRLILAAVTQLYVPYVTLSQSPSMT